MCATGPPPGGTEASTNPNEPFVVVALALIVFTSPDDHLVTPVPAGTYRDSFCGCWPPSASGAGVVKDIQASSQRALRVSDYRGSYRGHCALSTATPTGICLRRREVVGSVSPPRRSKTFQQAVTAT